MVLDVQPQDRAGHAAGQQVQRVGGVAGEHHDVVVAGADEPGHGLPGPLQHSGADLRGVPGAAVHARVVRQQRGDVVGHRGERGRAGGEVEVGVAHPLARDERDPQVGTGHAGERGRARIGTGGQHSSHRGPPDPLGGPGRMSGPRLPAVVARRPGRHPEHPTAEEGCRPASRGLTLALLTWDGTVRGSGGVGQAAPLASGSKATLLPSRVSKATLLTRGGTP